MLSYSFISGYIRECFRPYSKVYISLLMTGCESHLIFRFNQVRQLKVHFCIFNELISYLGYVLSVKLSDLFGKFLQ